MNNDTNFGLTNRNLRQRDIIPPERLAACRATVGGVGAIGWQVALQRAAMGIPAQQLIDPDTVETVNLAPQGYLEDDLGRSKVSATADLCRQIDHRLETQEYQERFRKSLEDRQRALLRRGFHRVAAADLASREGPNRVLLRRPDVRRGASCPDGLRRRCVPSLSHDALRRGRGLRRGLHGPEHDLFCQCRRRPQQMIRTAPARERRVALEFELSFNRVGIALVDSGLGGKRQ